MQLPRMVISCYNDNNFHSEPARRNNYDCVKRSPIAQINYNCISIFQKVETQVDTETLNCGVTVGPPRRQESYIYRGKLPQSSKITLDPTVYLETTPN